MDTETGLEIVRILEKLKARGKTIIATTHDKGNELLSELRDRIKHYAIGSVG